MPIKGHSKTTKDENLPALPQEPYLLGKELGPMLNQENIHSPTMPVSKKLIHLLRHARIQREDDGAVRILENQRTIFQKHFLHCHHLSDDKWKKSMAGGGGNKKRYQK